MKTIITIALFFGNIFILSAQNIGIGETNPTESKLQVKATDSAALLLQNTATALNTKTALFYKSDNNFSGSIATIQTSPSFYRMGLFTFGGATAAGLKERISILDGGNVGIGTTNPTAKLEVAGSLKVVDGNQAAGKVLTSDAIGVASWQTPAVANIETEKISGGYSSSIVNTEVDFPGTNITVPVSGTYLINYFLDANNDWSLNCNACSPPVVYSTEAFLYNKTTPEQFNYVPLKVDFLLTDNNYLNQTNFRLIAHQVSGSFVKYLTVGNLIGFKMKANAQPGIASPSIMKLNLSSISLVRMY